MKLKVLSLLALAALVLAEEAEPTESQAAVETAETQKPLETTEAPALDPKIKRGLLDLGVVGYGNPTYSFYSPNLYPGGNTVIAREVPVAVPVERHYPVVQKVAVAVDRPVVVSVPKPYPVEVTRHVPVAVDRPVPVPVHVPAPYPVPVIKNLAYTQHQGFPIFGYGA